jgi:hypothetical protein
MSIRYTLRCDGCREESSDTYQGDAEDFAQVRVKKIAGENPQKVRPEEMGDLDKDQAYRQYGQTRATASQDLHGVSIDTAQAPDRNLDMPHEPSGCNDYKEEAKITQQAGGSVNMPQQAAA